MCPTFGLDEVVPIIYARFKFWMGRARKKWVQLPLRPRTWGGAREGAGRKKSDRAGVPHRPRAKVKKKTALHVTVRLVREVRSLRRFKLAPAMRRAFAATKRKDGFRLCQFSIQRDHLHLACEADSNEGLSRGMQGLAIRMARALNRLWRRVGNVFADRYHDRILQSPREVWNALRYVLCNVHKHGAWTSRTRHDPFSSAPWFEGWRGAQPKPEQPSPAARARAWLLRTGWSFHGLIDIDATPVLALPRTQ